MMGGRADRYRPTFDTEAADKTALILDTLNLV